MRIQLKRNSKSHLDFVKKLFNDYKLKELHAESWPEKEQNQLLRFQFTDHENYYKEHYPDAADYVIYCDNHPAGRFIFNKGEDNWQLADMIISPEYRKKGIGKKVLTKTINTAVKKGKKISCYVDKYNPIIDFYHGLGFKIIREEATEYYMEI